MGYRGKSLKALRENKEIKLRRIANETRIGIAYLQDLEEERFDRFPGKFYFKSFVRAYARAIDLDPEEVLHDLQLAYEDWSGERALDPLPTSVERAVEDGFFNRVVGYIRRTQEV